MQPDNFDKQIREVLTNKHFAYDPAAWEQAAALLDQQQRKKRLFWWIWPVLGVLLITIVGAVQYAQQSTPADPAASLAKQNNKFISTVDLSATDSTASQQTEEANHLTSSTTDVAQGDEGRKPTQKDFYSSKKAIITQPLLNPTAAIPAIDSANDPLLAAYPMLQPKGLKFFQRIFYERSLNFKEVEAPLTSIEPEKRNSRGLSIGLHGFGGTTLGSSENSRPFNYGGGAFMELRYNKLYFSIEPAIHQVTGVSGGSSRSDTSYSFGQIIKTQTLNWNNLLLAQIPLLIGIEVYPKHTLAAGLIAQQYLQSNYTLSEITYRQGYPPSETSESGGQARISTLFVPRFVGLLRYQYQLSPAFSLGLQYNLINTSTPTPLPTQLQFQIKYHIFNRSKQ